MTRPAEDIRNIIQARHPGAVVIDRGPTWIRHHLGGQDYNWTGTAGGRLHFGPAPFGEDSEIDTAWIPGGQQDLPWLWVMKQAGYNLSFGPGVDSFDAGQIIKYVHPESGEDVTFQPLQLQWTNDLDQIEPIADPQPVPAALDDDTLTFLSAFGPDLDFQWKAQSTRLAKYLHIVTPSAVGSPPAWMDPAGLALKLQFIFQVSNAIDVYIDGQLWNKSTRTQTTAEVEFRLDDTTLWSFKAPRAFGFEGEEIACPQVLTKSGPNLLVEVRVPWSWLQTAAYPVTIDPTVNEIVGASADDAQESTVGFVTTDGSYLACSQAGAWVGARFQTVAVEGTINSATFWIWCANAANDDPDVVLYAEDEDDTSEYSAGSTSDISGRNYTDASTAWNESSIGTGYYAAPDLADEVQEVVDRGGWSSGNDMCIAYAGQSSSSFTVNAYDGDPTRCPKLDIDYTSGGAPEAASLFALLGVGE